MAMTPEARVKKEVKKQLDELGAFYFFPATGGYGRSGVPDVVGCYRGCFFAVECKAGKGKTTALQDLAINNIRKAGGVAIVVNETNVHEVMQWVRDLSK